MSEQSNIIQVGNIVLNEDTFTVKCGRRSGELTVREYKLLRYLMVNKDRVVSKDEFIKELWGENAVSGNSIEVYVKYIRNKAGSGVIQTRRGFGYRIGKI